MHDHAFAGESQCFNEMHFCPQPNQVSLTENSLAAMGTMQHLRHMC